MEFTKCIIQTPATPEYILNVFKDEYRHACEYEETDPVELTFDTTIRDFRGVGDLLEWKQLGKAYNEWFGIEFDNAKWKSLFKPEYKKKLGQLCSEIAKHTYQEKIRPISIFGKQCYKGGIFFVLKSKLAEAGANVEKLAPSSDLAEYTRLYPEVFLNFSAKYFPNVIPPVKISASTGNIILIGSMLAGLLLLAAGAIYSKYLNDNSILGVIFTILGVLIVLFSYILVWVTSCMPPSSVKFGDLETFRDLVDFITKAESK